MGEVYLLKSIDKADVMKLVQAEGEHFVSLYMPTGTHGAESRQNPTRYRNLLRSAARLLVARGMAEEKADSLLAPAREILDQPPFWQSLAAGLAVHVTDGANWVWRMPRPCEELCIVGGRFHVVPLVAWLAEDASCFILAASLNKARLIFADSGDAREVTVPGLPSGATSALGYDQPEGSFQAHSGQPQFRGKEGLVFHGQGGASDVAKVEAATYFRLIDEAIGKYLRGRSEPLVFAGVDYHFPMYRDVNRYPHLLPRHVSGNPDLLSPAELWSRAQPLLNDASLERRGAIIQRYWDFVGRGRTSNRVEEVLMAANAGAVDTLFIDPATRRLGEFEPLTGVVRANDRPDSKGEDLVNLAATLVLRQGGSVETAPEGNVPGGGCVAAILRHAFTAPQMAADGANPA